MMLRLSQFVFKRHKGPAGKHNRKVESYHKSYQKYLRATNAQVLSSEDVSPESMSILRPSLDVAEKAQVEMQTQLKMPVLNHWRSTNKPKLILTPMNKKESQPDADTTTETTVLYGTQTRKSRKFFNIGLSSDTPALVPMPLITSIAKIKQATAWANYTLGKLNKDQRLAINRAAQRIINGNIDRESFPLSIYQTGSGTQTNMNVNEVIANVGTKIGPSSKVGVLHPNDDVNRGTSSNCVIPTAMHVTLLEAIRDQLEPALDYIETILSSKSLAFQDVLKVGRTHGMDAVPMSLGYEFSVWVDQVRRARGALSAAKVALWEVPLGGTAVGTGVGCGFSKHAGFAKHAILHLREITGLPLKSPKGPFGALTASHGHVCQLHHAVQGLAVVFLKMSKDITILASGPRAGLQELQLPQNEPGSSIMPGKVNPTQLEALANVCVTILGNDVAMSIADSNGLLQLNTYKLVMASTTLQSITLLSDACRSVTQHCLRDLRPNREQMTSQLHNSLSLATLISEQIGYDKAANLSYFAQHNGTSLREANEKLHYLPTSEFDAITHDMDKLINTSISK